MRSLIVGVAVALLVGGCASYRTTLTNSQGQTITCEASGKSGFITGYYLRRGFEDCVTAAEARGFHP